MAIFSFCFSEFSYSFDILFCFQVPFGIFCVFDGHGGSAAAKEARRYRCNTLYLVSMFKTEYF